MQYVIAVLALLSASVSVVCGYTCYIGQTTDGSLPLTGSGCSQCSKSISKMYGQTVTNYGGVGCTSFVTPATTPIVTPITYPPTTQAPAITACGYFTGMVSASMSSQGPASVPPTPSSISGVCVTTTNFFTCSYGSDSGSFSMCSCCSDNCNNMKCGATAVTSSILGMLLVSLIAFALRQ